MRSDRWRTWCSTTRCSPATQCWRPTMGLRSTEAVVVRGCRRPNVESPLNALPDPNPRSPAFASIGRCWCCCWCCCWCFGVVGVSTRRSAGYSSALQSAPGSKAVLKENKHLYKCKKINYKINFKNVKHSCKCCKCCNCKTHKTTI